MKKAITKAGTGKDTAKAKAAATTDTPTALDRAVGEALTLPNPSRSGGTYTGPQGPRDLYWTRGLGWDFVRPLYRLREGLKVGKVPAPALARLQGRNGKGGLARFNREAPFQGADPALESDLKAFHKALAALLGALESGPSKGALSRADKALEACLRVWAPRHKDGLKVLRHLEAPKALDTTAKAKAKAKVAVKA